MKADVYTVEKGKIKGKYKPVIETENEKWAWKIYYEAQLELLEQKRIRVKRYNCSQKKWGEWKTLKHLPCYYA